VCRVQTIAHIRYFDWVLEILVPDRVEVIVSGVVDPQDLGR
jgi:hypothetical protein